MYGNVVLEIRKDDFEHVFDAVRRRRPRRSSTPSSTADDLQEVIVRLQEAGAEEDRQGLPAGPAWSSCEGARDAVFRSWLNDRATYYRKHERDSRRPRHRRQRAGHGVRQHGRDLGHRRGLHAQPGHRREGVLRRVPGERAGRGRGGRHPHAAADHRAAKPGMPRSTSSSARSPPCWRSTTGHPGLRVHHPGRQAVHAADPQRQAHGSGGGAHRGRDGGREA